MACNRTRHTVRSSQPMTMHRLCIISDVTSVARLNTSSTLFEMTHNDHTPHAALARSLAFVPERLTHARVCGAGADVRTVEQYSHARLARLDARLDGKLDVPPTLHRRVPFAEWSSRIARPFERVQGFTAWRDERSHDAVIQRLLDAIAQPHTITRSHDHIFTVAGKLTHTHGHTITRDAARRLACVVEYRRQARRYRRAFLRSHYWGTLTSDGMSLSATTTANRLAPLDRAIALSDTYVAEHGHTLTNVWFARGATRLDDGNVDSAATLHVAKVRHTHKGR